MGHIISTSFDDEAEIANKRNKLCGQINNCICFFANHDPITKLSLLKAYCTSHYGSVLWDLSHPMVDDYCVVWRKGLSQVKSSQVTGVLGRRLSASMSGPSSIHS